MSAAESGIPDLRATLAFAASEKADWANFPISSIMSLVTNPAGTTENAALISAKAPQAIRFQTKQSSSMKQIFFQSVLLTDELPKGGKSPFHSPAVEVFSSFSFQILLFTAHLHHFVLSLAILSQR